jgi:hypothetical protein
MEEDKECADIEDDQIHVTGLFIHQGLVEIKFRAS